MAIRKIRYPRRVKLGRIPTPLERVTFSQVPQGTELYIKRDDLTETVMSGNKVRKLEFLLAEARQAGCDTVMTCGGVQSNHARTTAFAAARLGMQSILFLRGSPDSVTEANLLLDRVVGATIEYLGAEEYVHYRDQIMEEHARKWNEKGRRVYLIPEGGSNATGTWGYVRALEEIHRQCSRRSIRISAILAAVGSGGTHSGLLLGTRLLGWNVPVYGINICDNAPCFVERIARELESTIRKYELDVKIKSQDIRVIDGYVGDGYAIAPAAVHDLIQCFAQESGIVLEPVYTGKAFYGMFEELSQGRFGRRPHLLFVHTGGIFGLLTQKYAPFYR